MQRHDLTGKKFGRLVCQWPVGKTGEKVVWLCLCDCGGLRRVIATNLRRGVTRSCGCLRIQRSKECHTTHGLTKGYAWINRTVPTHYRLFLTAKKRAKRSGIEFSIALEDVQIPECCPLLGILLKKGTLYHHDASPSLDRIDPLKGYVPGNVWVISHRANQIKSDATIEELKAIATALEGKLYGFLK